MRNLIPRKDAPSLGDFQNTILQSNLWTEQLKTESPSFSTPIENRSKLKILGSKICFHIQVLPLTESWRMLCLNPISGQKVLKHGALVLNLDIIQVKTESFPNQILPPDKHAHSQGQLHNFSFKFDLWIEGFNLGFPRCLIKEATIFGNDIY